MRTQTIKFNDFLSGEYKKKITNGKKIIKIILIAGTATVIFLTTYDIGLASTGTGIDASATKIYGKLLSVGKWIIIIKGAIDTINHTIQGDFNSAKKLFLSYLVVYLVLQGLPWAMNQVDEVFKGL